MKILLRISLCFLFTVFSVLLTMGYVVAADADDSHDAEEVLSLEEAKALIDSLPTVEDATAGTVSVDTGLSFYDIYSRQIVFRENSKAFRQSMETRRENYKNLYIGKRDAYTKNINALYRAEIAAYQDDLVSNDQESSEHNNVENESAANDAEEEDGEERSDSGLKEEPIPVKEGGGDQVKKKVVTSDDAPDFDPADLPEEDEGWDDEEFPVE